MLPDIYAPDSAERQNVAVPGVEFTRMWLTRLNMDFSDPNTPGRISYLLQPLGYDANGRAHLSPAKPTRVDMDQALVTAHSTPTLMKALQGLFVALADGAGLQTSAVEQPLDEPAPQPARKRTKKQRLEDELCAAVRRRGVLLCCYD